MYKGIASFKGKDGKTYRLSLSGFNNANYESRFNGNVSDQKRYQQLAQGVIDHPQYDGESAMDVSFKPM